MVEKILLLIVVLIGLLLAGYTVILSISAMFWEKEAGDWENEE